MASVVKDSRDRSPFFIACYTDSTGRRLKKSTKLTNKKAALEVALALEHGEDQARKGTFTEARLRDLLEQTLERVIGAPVQHYTCRSWFEEWCEEKSRSRSPATSVRYAQVARDFLSSLGPRADLALEHISARDVRLYRDAALKKGASNGTANLVVSIISMGLHRAVRQGKLKNHPCLELDTLDGESVEREPFTPDEIKNLLKAASGDWKGAILFAYFTGARLGDVANMRWSAIDLDKGLITFTPKKTKRGKKVLRIPLHPDLEKELLKHPGVGGAFLFPSLAERGTGGTGGLSEEFSSIKEQAGVHGTVIRHTAKGRSSTTKSFHSLRHSFVSALANAGVAHELRQVLVGHASEKMNEIYTHRELEPLRSAIAALPGL
jgi:integrase